MIFAQRILRYFISTVLLCNVTTSYGKSIRIDFWEHEIEKDQVLLDEWIQNFQKENPNITVRRAHYQTEDLRTQFQTAAMGGSGGADLILAPNDFAGPFSIMGIIQPADKFFQADQFFEAPLAAITDDNKQVWGVPFTHGNHLMLFTNKKLVPEAPRTVDDLIIAAKKITNVAENRYGFAYSLNEPFQFAPFYGAFGEELMVNGKPNLSGKAMTDALTLVRKLKFDDKIVPSDCDANCADTLFFEGKVGMVINGDWMIQRYQDLLKDDLIISPLPLLGTTGKHMAPLVSGKFFMFNRQLKGDKLEATKKFVAYLTSQKIQEELVTRSQRLPALKAAAGSEVMAKQPHLEAALAALEHGKPMPMAIEMRAVWDAMRTQLQHVMAGRVEPEAASQSMQRVADMRIREMKE